MSCMQAGSRFWRLSETLRGSAPLVHNVTNLVVQNLTADAIAAVGGTQITLHIPEEAGDVAGISGALAVNAGTPDGQWLQCAREAIAAATESGKPWVLDPVAVGLTRHRTDIMLELLDRGPTVLKANASEALALAGQAAGGHGADSRHGVGDAVAAATGLARRHGCTVVVTGAEDLVTDGERCVRMGNGSPLMGRMIGSGCMLTSVLGCYLAVADAPFEAAQAALAHFTIAGEIASEQAEGPGTLKALLIDALYNFDRPRLVQRLAVNAA